MSKIVYVVNKDGKPLMPTVRCGHVRILLKEKRAVVFDRNPFTIQLLYETPDIVQDLYLGIDPGRTNIGIAVVKENGTPVMEVQVTTRNKDVPKLMAERKEHRQKHRRYTVRQVRQRRAVSSGTTSQEIIMRKLPGCEKPIQCRFIKNKEARFNNRKRPEGWLTPTANHLLQTHINVVNKISKYLPISKVVLEVNWFAFMELDNPHIQKWQYQRGPLYGKGSLKAAIEELQEGHCLLCANQIDHFHHVVPRHLGGSNTLPNMVGLCENHHGLVHVDSKVAAQIKKIKDGLNKKYGALSVLNQIIPFLVEDLANLFPGNMYVTSGRSTYDFRKGNNIPKDHHYDAYCIASSALPTTNLTIGPDAVPCLQMQQFRRHDRQACHQEMIFRKYTLDGKLVATNRHKALEQQTDSLEEYRQKLMETTSKDEAETVISKLVVKEHLPRYKNSNRPLPGSIFVCDGRIAVLHHSSGTTNGQPNYYFDTSGNRYLAKKCIFIRNNQGLCFLPN